MGNQKHRGRGRGHRLNKDSLKRAIDRAWRKGRNRETPGERRRKGKKGDPMTS